MKISLTFIFAINNSVDTESDALERALFDTPHNNVCLSIHT